MSSFTDTSKWKMKNNHTLLYRRGDEEVECTSEPVYFEIEFDQFSLHKKVIRSANDLNEGDETTFRTYTSIDGKGNLDGCVIHLISFDEIDNETFSTIYVSIAGVPEEQVKSSNGVSRYSIDMGERPENGWFEGELGNIFFQGEGEFADKSSIRAVLYLSEDRFAQLVEDLQGGGVTNMRLEVGADLFKFNYESMGIGLPNHKFNYAFLREESGKNLYGEPYGDRGTTKAKLEEIQYSWSTVATPHFKIIEDEDIGDDEKEFDLGKSPFEREQLREFSSIKEEVGKIRNRIDTFYTALIFLCIVVAIQQVTTWFG